MLYSIRRPERVEREVTTLHVNGAARRVAVRPYDVLLDVLREHLNLTGTRRGCDMGTCGCCTVLVDGRPTLSCLTLALEAEGREITTVEGLVGEKGLHPVQEAFASCGGSQCGYCTPGVIMTAKALLDRNPHPTPQEIKEATAGNLCRCTGYNQIVEAVEDAAAQLRAEAK
jgi:carbon-monoxide dehydrogenase small subunit